MGDRMNGHERTPSRSLLRERDGSAVLYVTVALAVFMGIAALAIDMGRLFTTSTFAKQAADAAAIAAASQLDGKSGAIARAQNAAMNTPLVLNPQTLGATPGNVAIVNIRFLDGLPAGDPTVPNDPTELDPFVVDLTDLDTRDQRARFAEVTTEQIVQNNWFNRVAGAPATFRSSAISVAGFTQTLCRRAPLAICNPAEDELDPATWGSPFDPAPYIGKQIFAKASSGGAGGDAAWTPGDFALVDIDGLQSAPAIAEALAEDQPDVCITPVINVKPGQTQATRSALNTRFDMYENPYFHTGAAKSNPKFRPARNVTKGMTLSDPADMCSSTPVDPGSSVAKKMPRDSDISAANRFGNGVWDCEGYVAVNHPTIPSPSLFCAANPMTRHQMYRAEIDGSAWSYGNPDYDPGGPVDPDTNPESISGNLGIPNNSSLTPTGENGNPGCSSVAPTDVIDRRILYFAVINCKQYDVKGNSAGDIPVEAFVKAFITEPVGEAPDFDTFLEVIDVVQPGGRDGVLHDQVQLYR